MVPVSCRHVFDVQTTVTITAMTTWKCDKECSTFSGGFQKNPANKKGNIIQTFHSCSTSVRLPATFYQILVSKENGFHPGTRTEKLLWESQTSSGISFSGMSSTPLYTHTLVHCTHAVIPSSTQYTQEHEECNC